MFEQFTERARQVVVLAQDEARALGHDYIGTEHLLLGLLREADGLGARTLRGLGVTEEAAREQVRALVGQGESGTTTGQIPFTPRGKQVLELSLREALRLGHNHIGTEHVLLGLVRLDGGTASAVLHALGHDGETVRNEVMRQLVGVDGDDHRFAHGRDAAAVARRRGRRRLGVARRAAGRRASVRAAARRRLAPVRARSRRGHPDRVGDLGRVALRSSP